MSGAGMLWLEIHAIMLNHCHVHQVKLYSHDCVALEYTFSSVSSGERCPISQVTPHWRSLM